MNYLKKLARLHIKIAGIVYALFFLYSICSGEFDLYILFTGLFGALFVSGIIVMFWLFIQAAIGNKTKDEIRDEEEREKLLAQARSEGAKQAREFARVQGINSAVNPTQVCSVCQGRGSNAAGYVCPVCNGTGLSK